MQPTFAQMIAGYSLVFAAAVLIGFLLARATVRDHRIVLWAVLLMLVGAMALSSGDFYAAHDEETYVIGLVFGSVISPAIAALGIACSYLVPNWRTALK